MSDIPAPVVFVDPDEIDATYRVCLWAAPGEGKSVAAASAPDPLVVLSADRPSAYRFARRHHVGKDIREVRYLDPSSLEALYRYLRSDEGADVRTVVLDPVVNIIEDLRDHAPARADGDIDHQWVNKKILGFVQSLRSFDVNVVLVTHEKLNDGKRGDGKLYPALGGAGLINKLLAEMDIVAHVERRAGSDDEETKWVGVIQPTAHMVGKDSTDALGDRRIIDLSRWFDVANEALAPDQEELPWDGPVTPDSEPAQPELAA